MIQRPDGADNPLPLWRVLEDEFRELHATGTEAEWRRLWQAERERISRASNGAEPTDAQLEAALHRMVHQLGDPDARTALCLSGGGIRSASFGLGVLQGLARKGLLSRFHYLSTVSGGGYIGTWLSSWIHRHTDGLPGTEQELAGSVSLPADTNSTAHPVQQLRRYSNYLSPRAGLFSTDTWTLIATFLRNLLANWLVLLPWLLLLLLTPRLMISLAGWPWFSMVPVPPWLLYLVLVAAWTCCLFAVKYAHDEDEEPRADSSRGEEVARVTGEFLRECLIPMVGSAMLLVVALAWYRAGGLPDELVIGRLTLPALTVGGGAFGASVHWAGWLWSTEKRGSIRDDLGILLSGLLAGLLGGAAAQMALRLPEDPMWLVAYVWLAPSILLALFIFGSNLYAAWAGINNRTTDADMEWTARMGAHVLRSGTAWVIASGVVYYGPVLFDLLPKVASLSGVAALFSSSVVSGWSGSTEAGRRSEQTARGARWLDLATRLAGPVFLGVILAWLSALTSLLAGALRDVSWLSWAWGAGQAPGSVGIPFRGGVLRGIYNHLQVLCELNVAGVLAFGAVVGVLFLFFARNVALNKFSLHHMYRERLIRAYLGANRSVRRPDPFTGFDPDDNLPVGLLWPLGLTPGGVFDPEGLLVQIRDGKTPVTRAVRGRLSPGLAARLAAWSPGRDTEMLLTALCYEFNRIKEALGLSAGDQLQKADIADYLHGGWDELAAVETSERDRYKVRLHNRLVLEDACASVLRGGRPGHGSRPLHLINMTLNLTSDPELAWQDRKGESFTVSPLHAGAGDATLGYRRTDWPAPLKAKRYGGDRGVSVGTALAISGAAASPNMGYHSSPIVTFLLTLFNARLGWWLGNPGKEGKDTFPDYYVKRPVRWLLRELRGKTNRTAEYVYLSDGGHFENLGLYEVVRRRCRFVIVSDAGCDPEASFEDLGNAIRKIRIDLGIAIEFPNGIPIYSRSRAAEESFQADTARPYALGRIRYSEVDKKPDGSGQQDGVLLYLKPAVYGREPVDVRNYATKHRQFPHETTADQWFSEPQLESYRALGLHVVDQALTKAQFESVASALKQVDQPAGRLSGEWRSAL